MPRLGTAFRLLSLWAPRHLTIAHRAALSVLVLGSTGLAAAPIATITGPERVTAYTQGMSGSLDGVASVPPQAGCTYQWAILPGGSGAGSITAGTTTNVVGFRGTSVGTITLRCIVTDAAGISSTGTLAVVVEPPPVITSFTASSPYVLAGDLTYHGSYGDPTTLNWATNQATSLLLNGESVLGNPTYLACAPRRRVNYVLTASNGSTPPASDTKVLTLVPKGLSVLMGALGGSESSREGQGLAARLQAMRDIATDGAGNFYVTNSYAICKITPEGVVSTLAGVHNQSGYVDSPGGTRTGTERFVFPYALAADPQGNVYVVDGNSMIRKVTPLGVVSTIGGYANVRGAGTGGVETNSTSTYPRGLFNFTGSASIGIAVDPNTGNLYVTEGNKYKYTPGTDWYYAIRCITPNGTVSTFFRTPTPPRVWEPYTLYRRITYHDGHLYCISGGFERDNPTGRPETAPDYWVVAKLNLSDLSWSPVLKTNQNSDSNYPFFQGNPPDFLAFGGSQGHDLYLGYFQAGKFVKFPNAHVGWRRSSSPHTIFGGSLNVTLQGSSDGSLAEARFFGPSGAVPGLDGSIFVSEFSNRIVRQIKPNDEVTTFAGMPDQTSAELPNRNGSFEAARLPSPTCVITAPDGRLFIAESGSHAIRMATDPTAPHGQVTTIVGKPGTYGQLDGAGDQARFFGPRSLALGWDGALYVADTNNNRIRKVAWDAATGTWNTTTLTLSATVNSPTCIVSGGTELLYVLSNASIKRLARQTDGSWNVTTFQPSIAFSPNALASDLAGNVYAVAGYYAASIYKVLPSGAATLVATVNNGGANFFSTITSIALGHSAAGTVDRIYLADYNRHLIYKLAFNGTTWQWASSPCTQQVPGQVIGQDKLGMVLPGPFTPGSLPPAIRISDGAFGMAVHPVTGDLLIPTVNGIAIATAP